MIKNNITESGYCVVCLYHNGKKYWRYVHRLVGEYFIEIPKRYTDMNLSIKDLEINHIDGSFKGKSNNKIINLEWCTSSENKYHAYRNNLKMKGESHPASKYTNIQIENVCKLLEENMIGNRDIWKITGVSVNTIQAILAGKQWRDISYRYDFRNHKKRHILYPQNIKEEVIDMLKTSDLSFKDIGDIVGMTRNSVWFINKKYNIRIK